MGNSASKASGASNPAKAAARHFPSANLVQEKAAHAARVARASTVTSDSVKGSGSGDNTLHGERLSTSPKLDYLGQQKRLEDELAKYDQALNSKGRLDGESRPLEDTPSAAELQFFGNLKSLGQVTVPNPDQIKHHEAEQILKRKLPQKSGASSFVQQPPRFSPTTSKTTEAIQAASDSNLSSLKLMTLLQLRNQDPSIWTEDRLAEEFGMKKRDVQALTKYINTYTILPGKDAKGRESGVWCDDLRGVEVAERPTAAGEAGTAVAGDESHGEPTSKLGSKAPAATKTK